MGRMYQKKARVEHERVIYQGMSESARHMDICLKGSWAGSDHIWVQINLVNVEYIDVGFN